MTFGHMVGDIELVLGDGPVGYEKVLFSRGSLKGAAPRVEAFPVRYLLRRGMVEFRSTHVGHARRRAAALGYTLQCRDGRFALTEIVTQKKVMGFSVEAVPEAPLHEVLAWLEEPNAQ